MSENLVYLDNAASTRVDDRVIEAMKPYLVDTYAVATSDFAYSLGIDAKEGLEQAREDIAKQMNISPQEFIFTSGGTESSNLALKGVAEAQKENGNHIIISKIEDFPVLKSAEALEKKGFEVTKLDVDDKGSVDIEQLKNEVRDDTILTSIQHANQEIGTVQDIETISEICQDENVIFHTDATHTFTRIPLNFGNLPIDLATISSHTIHGPKGIGGLYIKEGTPIQKRMDGGFQENNLRAGVENIPGAVGFAKATELVTQDENERLKDMRDALIESVLSDISATTLNGPRQDRTPQNANITFHYVEGESITLHLDMRGFAVSTGSACFSKSLEASHVILGMGGDHERAHGSVRFSFGRFNGMEDVEKIVESISEVVEDLREISPLGEEE
ncbi:cysteine desulfurase [candidate division MSBL1 archaeon SCGC-AAA382C18]|uniref:Cysteine desulfurase n=1 Tax=candidate division MSBL1 archaeon SCGC-AAA382C18 TaxID=1698281 RepID=A0A133VJU4_9EURY|nr:cysteine desulfurase [candidate division MSBL1 archaeon SCGC-AAA382C18]